MEIALHTKSPVDDTIDTASIVAMLKEHLSVSDIEGACYDASDLDRQIMEKLADICIIINADEDKKALTVGELEDKIAYLKEIGAIDRSNKIVFKDVANGGETSVDIVGAFELGAPCQSTEPKWLALTNGTPRQWTEIDAR